uniref:Putative odorant binding protein 61 n=1 Tax=Nasonia vitripennis TaxID=7425 RepID=G8B1R6_NASVI|nr:putative odorant binding protein 61 [Nasonia vitripennis]
MKIYVICAVLLFAPAALGLFSNGIWDVLHANEAKCQLNSGASDASIEDARRARKLSESPEMNAFAKCMLGIYNVMRPDGSINPDFQSYTVPTDVPNNTWRISQKCITLGGTDSGDTARKIFNCYTENNQLVMAWTPKVSV